MKVGGQSAIMGENIISFSSADLEQVGCDRNLALRFMGCRSDVENTELDRLYCECLEIVKKEVFFKAVWRKTSVSIVGEDKAEFEFGTVTSASLCKNLKGCKSAYIFAATAGLGIDRLILRFNKLDPVKAMIISAIGSSCVECWCDRVNEEIVGEKKSVPRFSPGYGGVELKHQREIIDFLDAEKSLGITLTDSFFMTPVKSVTAFVGIRED